jgi:hypothetical protein
MTQKQAVVYANSWVRGHFSMVPQVVSARLYNDELLLLCRFSLGEDPPLEEWGRVYGKWKVSYFCNWDTDILGLPETLHVLVDNVSGEAEQWIG